MRYIFLWWLIYWLIPAPTSAADLTVTISTLPGATTTEIQLIGGGVSLNSPKALYFTLEKGALTTTIPASVIDRAFPDTDYLCVTARKLGTLVWWAHADGTLNCVRWPTTTISPPPPIVVSPPPPINALRDAIHTGITACLNRRMVLTTCLKLIDVEIQKVAP